MPYDTIRCSLEASLSDIKWLAGYWRGEKWGSQIEEIMNVPMAGSMMGSFKLLANKIRGKCRREVQL